MKKSDSDNMAESFKLKVLKEEVQKLQDENDKLKRIIKENDIEDVDSEVVISDEEYICVNEIKKLKKLSELGSFTQEEAKTLDILYKNLRMIRGMSEDTNKKRNKKVDVKELFKIVEDK